MTIYKAPVEDVTFLLNDVFQIDRYNNLPGFSDATADVRAAIFDEAAKFAEKVLQPLNHSGDLEGCTRHDDGRVTTPAGFKEAFKQMAEGGWLSLAGPAEFGGQGLPVTLSQTVNEFMISANMAFSMYGGLTMGAMAALLVHGSDAQKKTFVPRMTQRDLAPIGALKTFQKDVETIAAAAAATGTPMPVAGTVQQLLRLGAAMGLGEADLSAFIDVLQTPRTA